MPQFSKNCPYFLFTLPFIVLAQTKTVSGVITDSKGAPVPNVTITVKGSKTAVSTNVNGAFTINAATGATLIITAINFDPYEIKVGASNSYEVQLTDKQAVMTDVVVVGYGKSSRKNLSSAITTIKAEDLNKGAITDVGRLLQGKVPGLT